jgi:hypothetical protein
MKLSLTITTSATKPTPKYQAEVSGVIGLNAERRPEKTLTIHDSPSLQVSCYRTRISKLNIRRDYGPA